MRGQGIRSDSGADAQRWGCGNGHLATGPQRPGKAARPGASEPEDLSTGRRSLSGGTGHHGPATRAVGKGADRMTSALDRLGALTTTGVGSLPFAAPAVAACHAARAYD